MVEGKEKSLTEEPLMALETWAFEIELPYPPSLNTLYPTNKKTFRRFLSKKGKDYKQEIIWLLVQAKAPRFDEIEHVDVVYIPPDKRKRDRSNLAKAWEDAFTEYGVWKDDSLVNSSWERKLEPDKERPGMAVRVIGKIKKPLP